ncbi:MAG: OPT family oligopeptide transporter [Phycisphaerales bacterium]
MAIKQLTPEQVQSMSRLEKDRWWLENVFRGNMPQLTIRSAITGFILGGLLSATNLYIGAKTGWSLGVGLTSVILAFAMFKGLSAVGLAKDFTILENNCMQSIATAAGYMTGPLISGIAAYMMVANIVMPWHQMLLINIVLAVLGVLVAFPMKRRFINDEQHPFPEGAACGVVLDTLYTSDAKVGLFKAKALVAAAGLAGFISFLAGGGYQSFFQKKLLGFKEAWTLPTEFFGWYYDWAAKAKLWTPKVFGSDIRNLGLNPTLDLAMFGAGGLLNIRYATSMLLGMAVMWGCIAPWAVQNGDVTRPTRDPVTHLVTGAETIMPAMQYDYREVLVSWALWPGIAMLVVASMLALFAKPKVLISSFQGFLQGKKSGSQADADPVKHIELPLWISFVGVPLVGALGVWMLHDWYGVKWYWGALSIPLIIALTLIAANATALTSITPTGSLSKITQFTFGGLERITAEKAGLAANPATNLMTALMTTEVASNASNLLMDIKPGYMLGAKPRQQALGHCIGIIAGAAASTPLFYLLFLSRKETEGKSVIERLVSNDFGFPGALQWKGVSDLLSKGFGQLPQSALWAMGIAAVLGLLLEIARISSKNKFPLSPIALGLGVVIPPESTMAMFAGSAFFYITGKMFRKKDESFGKRLFVDTHEPMCAGIIAGAALVGIGDILMTVFAG